MLLDVNSVSWMCAWNLVERYVRFVFEFFPILAIDEGSWKYDYNNTNIVWKLYTGIQFKIPAWDLKKGQMVYGSKIAIRHKLKP